MDNGSVQEYLSVLVSIVVGLGLSQLLAGVGRLVVERHRVRMYGLTLAQTAFTFVATVQFWWSTFGYGEEVAGNFFHFLFFLLTPITLYLLSAVVLPDLQGESEGDVSLKEHYWSVRPWYFGLLALVPALNAVRNHVIQGDRFWNQDRPYEAAFLLLALSGLLVRGERWHLAIAWISLGGFAAMILLVSLAPG